MVCVIVVLIFQKQFVLTGDLKNLMTHWLAEVESHTGVYVTV